jgi:hypothetical protein
MIKKKDFKNISMNGRLAYQLMCAERFFTTKYPEKDFKELFSLLWQVTNGMYWDTFSGYLIELEKSNFFEFETYEEQSWLYVTKEQYDLFKKLIQEFDDEDEKLLETLKDQTEVYCYTIVPKNTHESIDIIFETISLLLKYHIPLPDINLISFSTIDQRHSWGNHFDGTKFSIILNKD